MRSSPPTFRFRPSAYEALARSNKTPGWLAQELDVSRSYVSGLLHSKRNASAGVRSRVMTIEPFDQMTFDELFVRVDPSGTPRP